MSNNTSIDVGLYFGGSSMSIAYFRDNKVSVIVNEAGDRWTPSIVAINAGEYSIGLPAKQNLIRNAANTVAYTKHFIGKEIADVGPQFVAKNQCEVKLHSTSNELAFLVEKNEQPYEMSLSEAIETKLKYLNELAKTSLSIKECVTVLSVPGYFTKAQCDYLKQCATNVGFNILRIIKNPLAACLAYDLEEDNTRDGIVLVYQMGGNTIESTLVEIRNGLYRCIDAIDVHDLGGDQFTDIVVDILCEEFIKKHKSDPRVNKRSLFKLKYAAQDCKHVLSSMERAHASIDALFEGIDFDFYLTRQRFDVASSKLCKQVLQPIDTLLARNNFELKDISQVVICGAATKMVQLQSMLKAKLPDATLLNTQSPDEIIALGCAKQAFLINSSKVKNIPKDVFFKCLSSDVYLRIGKSNEKTLLAVAKSPIPLKRTLNVDIDLSAPFVELLESDDRVLAKINVNKFTTKEISVMFVIKMSENVEVSVTERSTNEKVTAFLNADNAENGDDEPRTTPVEP